MSNTSAANNQPIPNWLIEVGKLEKSPLNARKTVSKAACEELKSSILAHGLMQNLVVTEGAKGKYYVIAGARRLEALKALQAEGKLPKDHAVPCQVVSAKDAEEMSLAENVVRLAMHPADQFEAFASLIDQGHTAEQIATRFGVSEKLVEQRMKLAKIAAPLIAAYRAEELTLDGLMAFTVTDDHGKQLAVYKSLNDWQRKRPGEIRQKLTEQLVEAKSKLAVFVGLDTYKRAGGTIRSDLFGEEAYLENPELLSALVEEKLKLEKQKLEAEGWLWVDVDTDRDWSVLNGCRRLEPEPVDAPQELRDRIAAIEAELEAINEEWDAADEEDDDLLDAIRKKDADAEKRLEAAHQELASYNRFDAEQMKSAGCYAYISHQGELEIEKGLVRREERQAAATADSGEAEPEKPKGMPESLKRDLAAYRLGAAQAEIANHPAIAFDLLVFKAARSVLTVRSVGDGPNVSFSREYCATACSDARGFLASQLEPVFKALPTAWVNEELEADQFAAFQQLTAAQKHQLLAYCVAVTMQPKLATEGRAPTAYDIALAQTGANVADYWRPGAANYLNRLGKGQLLDLGEKLFADNFTRRWANAKKSELVTMLDKAFAEPAKDNRPEIAEKLRNWLPAGMAFDLVAPEETATGMEVITIKTADGEMVELEAEVKGGLAVHKYLQLTDTGAVPAADDRFSVTHIASGQLIDPGEPFDSHAAALEYVEQMLALGDWSFASADHAPAGLLEAAKKLKASYRAKKAA